MKKSLGTLPDRARDFTYITFPYALSLGKTFLSNTARGPEKKGKGKVPDPRISSGALSLWFVLNDALMMFYRDRFLDVIGMIQDKGPPIPTMSA